MAETTKQTNYIYLLQEREFIKTNQNIFKIGRTTKENFKRFNHYPKGSILLFQMICSNCKNIEKNIITQFKKNFNHQKNIGNEYFEGDYKLMIDEIYNAIKNETINKLDTLYFTCGEEDNLTYDNNSLLNEDSTSDEDASSDEEKKIQYDSLCKNTQKIFSEYKNDESFGGNKKFIKIISSSEIIFISSNLNEKFNDDEFIDNFIDEYKISYSADEFQYIEKLINKKIISINEIYDINSTKFINKINKTKFKINIEYFDKIYQQKKPDFNECDINEKINYLFYNNMILNDCLYSSIVDRMPWHYEEINIFKEFTKFKNKNNKNSFNKLVIDIGDSNNYKITRIYNINSKFYDYVYLRKYIPYVIRWDDKSNYYMLNRDYEYIGSSNTDNLPNYIKQHYLYNDGCLPWDEKENFINMINEYKKTTESFKECLNKNELTNNIISISLIL